MATAAISSFEETRQAYAKTRARQQLHAYLDRGLDGREANMPDDTPSLEEVTQAVLAMRPGLTGKVAEALVEQQHGRVLHQRTMSCPQCQGLLPARPAALRTVHTMVGEVALCRPYFYGPPVSRDSLPWTKPSNGLSAASSGTCRRLGPDWRRRCPLRRLRSGLRS
jgi:hypothetical protein